MVMYANQCNQHCTLMAIIGKHATVIQNPSKSETFPRYICHTMQGSLLQTFTLKPCRLARIGHYNVLAILWQIVQLVHLSHLLGWAFTMLGTPILGL